MEWAADLQLSCHYLSRHALLYFEAYPPRCWENPYSLLFKSGSCLRFIQHLVNRGKEKTVVRRKGLPSRHCARQPGRFGGIVAAELRRVRAELSANDWSSEAVL